MLQESRCFSGTVPVWERQRDLRIGVTHPPNPSVWSLFTDNPRAADKSKLKESLFLIKYIKEFLKDFYGEGLPPSWHDDIPTAGDGRAFTEDLKNHPASELSRVPLDDLFSSEVYGGTNGSYRALARNLLISFLRRYYLFPLKRFRGAAAFNIPVLLTLINEWGLRDLPKLLPEKHVAQAPGR